LINCAEVEAIAGRPGDFTVTVRQHPLRRPGQCTGCGDCAVACPIGLPDHLTGPVHAKPFTSCIRKPSECLCYRESRRGALSRRLPDPPARVISL
jgi:ferredoxin